MSEPTLSQIQEAVRCGLLARRTSAWRIAQVLSCSPSTLHRRLHEQGTTLVTQINEIRTETAFELLRGGYSVSRAASSVGVSPDHLRLLMRQRYRWAPRRIKYAIELGRRLKKPPETTRAQRDATSDDAALQALLADIGPDHPLNEWARGLVLAGHHPETETDLYQRILRHNDRKAYREARERGAATAVEGMSEEELRAPLDIAALLEERAFENEKIPWRANQLRKARRRAGR
jgi:AraC-like DNA-binding protein